MILYGNCLLVNKIVESNVKVGRKGESNDPDRISGFNPYPGHVVASLDEVLCDDYLCLVTSTRSKFTWEEVKREPKNLENGQLLSW